MSKMDINDIDDLQKIVNHFYSKAMTDPIIGFFFTQVSPIDLDLHTPKIALFWQKVLFGQGQDSTVSERLNSGSMMNNMLKVHIDLDAKARLQTGHFTRWLHLFVNSVDEHYAGENAENLKNRAKKMSSSMSDALRSKRGEARIGVESLK